MTGPDRTTPNPGSSRHHEYKQNPPRPPNAWILYRSFKFAEIRHSSTRMSQADVSKLISSMWKNETEQVKRHFERLAEDRKAEHQQLYPNYRFAPQKKEVKLRAKEDRKQSRPPKNSNAPATFANATATTSTAAATPVPHPLPFMPQHLFLPGYQPRSVMPHPYAIPFIPPELRHGPNGPSPPISAAPSPTPCESSDSTESRPYSGDLASSSSSPSVIPSSSSESPASTSCSQIPVDPYMQSLPGSRYPSPNLNMTQPLPTFYETPGQLPPNSTQMHPSSQNAVVPATNVWNNDHAQLPNQQSSDDVVKLPLPVCQNWSELSGAVSSTPSSDCLQGMISRTDLNGIFTFSNMCPDFLVQPQGELELAMGPDAPTSDYRGEPFVDYELLEFQRQMAEFTDNGSSSSSYHYPPIQEDLKSLFRLPKDAEQVFSDDQQHQSSGYISEEMMNFLNFDAMEGSTEDASTTVSTVSPTQMLLPSTEQTAPIFTPMTNTPTVTSGTPYVPPAGAIYSSTRRVAGTWKPPFIMPEEPAETWHTLPTN